ncbi:MAG: hypothetical protein N3F67_03630 [Acidilobaceae archaeon]|nr:hypothetical protein [Acidilobaceae archaeon]
MEAMIEELKGLQAALLEQRARLSNLERRLSSLKLDLSGQAELYSWKIFLDSLIADSTSLVRHAERGNSIAVSVISCDVANRISSHIRLLGGSELMGEARAVLVGLLKVSRALCSKD